MDMGPEHGRYLMYGRGGQHMYGGMMKRPSEEIPPMWTLYFRVPDVDAAAATVKEQGGQVLTGPMEVPGGDRVAICRDPQGGTGVIGEHQEGAAGRNEAAVQRHPVHGRRHAVLADAVVDVAAIVVARLHFF